MVADNTSVVPDGHEPAETVPDDLLDMAHKAMRFSDESDVEGALADALAAVLPEHEKRVREQVTQELRDYAGERGDKWMPVIWETIRHCANLAGGDS